MKLHCKWVKNNSSDSEHGKLLTLRLDFLNCALFKYQPHVKKAISKSIYPFHVRLLQVLLVIYFYVVNLTKCT